MLNQNARSSRIWMRFASVATFCMSAAATVACDSTPQAKNLAEFDHGHLDVTALEGDVISEAPIIGRPYGLELSDGILWIRDGAKDPDLHALDVRTGGILQSVGRKGSGPGEFEGMFDTSVMGGKPGSVWAFDLRLQRLTHIEPDRPPGADSHTVQLQGSPRVVRAAWLTPREIIGVTEYSNSRFVHFDPAGARIGSVSGSLLGDPSAPEGERRKATITGFAICPHPSRGFGISYSTAGRVELYSRSGQLVDTASAPYPSQPTFELDDRTRRTKWSHTRIWYADCDATDRHLYGLFAGRSVDAYAPEEQTIAGFLHVFRWDDGNLVRVFRLDPPVGDIQVDPAESILYGSSEATAMIYRFRLPPWE